MPALASYPGVDDHRQRHTRGEILWGRRRGCGTIVAVNPSMERPMQRNDLSRSLVAFEQDSTLVAVVELSCKTWLVAGLVPGIARQPLKKQGADPETDRKSVV